jgi:hypothetical protein
LALPLARILNIPRQIFTGMKRIFLLLASAAIFTSCVEDTDLTPDRENFIGAWTCTEYEGDFAPQTYNVEVTANGLGEDVRIYGLYNLGSSTSLTGSVSGSTIFIDNQTVNGITFTGFGNINDDLDLVEVTFTADDAGVADNVKARWVR